MEDDTLPTRALWWPVSAILPTLGLKRDVFLAAVEKGDIPIRTRLFGERNLVYVSSEDTLRYVRSVQRPPYFGMTEEEFSEDTPFAPGFWRLPAVAYMLRRDPLQLLDDCESGRLPITVALLGESKRPYLRARDVVAHLATLKEVAA